ncbi:MAG: hypothetical protein HYR64_07260 [Fimbriimonas ginsengisoli]|uniref:Uncharacterized protein n=1 Tax=Fimbriimonas ginsengisoli TaxID=1005039 RepID=A0A931LT62_FIMGI|nr:hypothetical protein [Fimbriimonas ginsengisoli]
MNKSEWIRSLADQGHEVKQIAKETGLRYQHVRNVVVRYREKRHGGYGAQAGSEGVRIAPADEQGKLSLGRRHSNRLFRVSEQPDGNLLLEPVVMVHEREAWLYRNPVAFEAVKRGIEESRAGLARPAGPFIQYADDEDEE